VLAEVVVEERAPAHVGAGRAGVAEVVGAGSVPSPSSSHARCERGWSARRSCAGGPELAAIAVRAHGLTAREREIAQLLSDGCSTAQMAARLHLSAHTVRDYVKSVLGKVGVSTRGELVARLVAGAPA
jgi:DNA-binding CsgD family transcriptional regulator